MVIVFIGSLAIGCILLVATFTQWDSSMSTNVSSFVRFSILKHRRDVSFLCAVKYNLLKTLSRTSPQQRKVSSLRKQIFLYILRVLITLLSIAVYSAVL